MVEFIDRDELHSIICRNIKIFRKAKGLTQEQLADLIDISHTYMRELEREKGKKHFTFYTLYKISKVLEKPIDGFYSEK